jgi:HEPN domain-containing protein
MAENMLNEGDADYSTFHAQQAAEKALKALIVSLRRQPPKTHDIEALLETLEDYGVDTAPLQEIEAGELTKYAVKARYPDFEEEPTLEEAREALDTAREVIAWAREELRRRGVEC